MITVAHAFVATIGAIAQCGAVPVLVDYFDVYQNYVIRSTQRDRLAAHLRASGIEVLVSWPTPLHKQKALDLGHFNLPVTEKISKDCLSRCIQS